MAAARTGTSRSAVWWSWLLGAGLLIAVTAGALSLAEGREFVRLTERAQPSWLFLALLLQAGTYVAQGGIWRRVGRAAGVPLSRTIAFELSLAKLFADQALPSAGLSSSVLVASALEQRDVPPGAVRAAVAVNIASYHLAYVVALTVALMYLSRQGATNVVMAVASMLFLLFSAGLSVVVLALAGRPEHRLARAGNRFRPLAKLIVFLGGADAHLARSPRLLADAIALQSAIIFLDAATVWTLIRSLGVTASAGGVFASFMVASLVRTIGIVPGGLGTFEATSVLTLRTAGVNLPEALAATLLFRGLSFWLPMLPGYWFSRHAVRAGFRESRAAGADHYWSLDTGELLRAVDSTAGGLSSEEAVTRLRLHGPNELGEQSAATRAHVLARQLRSPLLLLLVFAAAASAISGEWLDATIVLAIVAATVGIGYSREYSAATAAAALRTRVRVRAMVLRDGRPVPLPIEAIVPGDVVLLAAGSLVPADGVVLEATDCFVSEAVLTGESFPVEKRAGSVPDTCTLPQRTNCVSLGTNVRSGTARAIVVRTGPSTAFGAIAHRLTLRAPETEFDRGIRRFGYLLTSVMLIMVLLVFAAHMLRGRPPIETLLFSIALAVGLSPELLPAILSVNLSRGASMMARHGVLVRRLAAIENLGSVDILCTDKTGTLTEGVIEVQGAYDFDGVPSTDVLELAACNAALETGISSPLDDAILKARTPQLDAVSKVAEIPFDFVRKRVTVVVRTAEGAQLITKGAFDHVVDVCHCLGDGRDLTSERRAQLEALYDDWCRQGIRVLAVAIRAIPDAAAFGRDNERDLTFVGFVTFFDQPKTSVTQAIADLAAAGVAVKVITGDSRLVAQHVARLVGLKADLLLTGQQLDDLNDEALWHAAEGTDIFAEVDPNQKERIILSLKKMGHVVAFLGDGVNDAPAMHAADTSLSVEHAVDVAREAADFVLLEQSLDVIRRGIEEGRRTFANTLKYILITTSANLGNMVSMAVASVFLPFLPLTAGQILLNNFLSDIPAIGLADDSVDPELVDRPRRWDIMFVGRYMLAFGLLSSFFDFLTFGVLLTAFRSSVEIFRTGWFVESLLTELVIALVVRTRRPFFRSRPGTLLLVSTAVLIVVTLAIPYLPFAAVFGFVRLSPMLLLTIGGIAALYVVGTELLKQWFYLRPQSR